MEKRDVREAIEVLDAVMTASGQTRQMLEMPAVVGALRVVGCDIGARPKDAPVFEDVRPHILAVRREPRRLTVEFDGKASELVEAFVAAERRCCSDLVFSVSPGDPTVMQVEAAPELVDMVEGWMAPGP
ncbi:MAG TPA: hypothetical protein VJP07_02940 [Dehalococcoidia bacterium]|nr:hypothetical protein [Dehalococcoidia bacterium]